MKRYKINLKRGEDFEAEIFFKNIRADGNEFDVDLDGYTLHWDVAHYNPETLAWERYIPENAFSTVNSVLRNGYILIEMTAVQTAALVDPTSVVVWDLWAESGDNRTDIASGEIRLSTWTILED